MTDDYKEKLLKWLTGNYGIETSNNVPQFLTATSNTNNLQTSLQASLGSNYTVYGQVQGGDNNNNKLELNAIYGGYSSGSNNYGFIYILDNNNNPIQMIKTYRGGSNFGIIEKLKLSSDGTFYGIENATSGRRLVLLNNFLVKLQSQTNYEVIYRQGYTLVGSLLNAFKINDVVKNENAGRYLISGTVVDSQGLSIYQPYATQLEIVVGGTNVWTNYSLATESDSPFDLFSTLATWDASNNLSLKLTGWVNDGLGQNLYTEYNNNSSDNLVAYQITPGISNIVATDTLVINNGLTYIAYIVAEPPNYTSESLFLGYIDYTTNSIVNIFTNYEIGTLETTKFNFFEINNQAFYSIVSNGTTSTYTIKVGKLIGTNYYENTLGTTTETLSLNLFSVLNQFNLYNYIAQVNNIAYTCNQIYNTSNYNGLPYQALNSMVPNSVNIYDPNGVVIFARNLYNRIVNNNTTISTVEVPNDFMNDVTIKLKELISETNNIMVSDIKEIVKNIYEELLINFVNSIIVKNSNNINNVIINNTASNRINNSVSNPSVLDYNNSKIGKYKINYGNGTSVINPINPDLTFTGLSTNYIITVYVPIDYGITSVQLLSNDEATIYQTIDCSNLENNKYYTINQKMEVV